MTDNKHSTVTPDSKPSFRDRIKTANIPSKAKNVAAAVGVVTVIGVAAATVTKKKGASLDVTLPDLDVTTNV